jgi:hypothetical protein
LEEKVKIDEKISSIDEETPIHLAAMVPSEVVVTWKA